MLRRLSEWSTGHSWAVPVLAGLLGAVGFTAILGPSLVDPTNIDWLTRGDFALHFLGWHLYRHGPWTMPIGATPLLIWPIGSTIGLTDSIPVAAFLFKLIDPVLPETFQFIGLWLVSCFALQGVFGALLMRLATPNPFLQLLGAVLFILSPPLIFRIGHAALAAHWLLLAALWLSLKRDADMPSWRLAGSWAAVAALAAAIQPYLLLMVMILMLAAHARQFIVAPTRFVQIGLHLAFCIAVAGLTLWQSGSLSVSAEAGLEIGGFGAWSTNLLSLISPTEGETALFPGPFGYAWPEQYEGYAYLGAGTLCLAVALFFGSIWQLISTRTFTWPRLAWRHVPMLVALLFLFAMAVGQTITFGSHRIYAYDVAWWGPLTIFRTNGRMIWPLYYAIVTGLLFAVCRLSSRRAVAFGLFAVVVQAADLSGMTERIRDNSRFGFRDPLRSHFWTVVPPHYQRLVLIPTNLCTRDGFIDYFPFALLAGRIGIAINAGATARYDWLKGDAYCLDLDREIQEGLRSKDSLYIVRADLLPKIVPQADATLCTVVDRYGVCFAPDTYTRWRDAYDVVRSKLPPTEEVVQFYGELNQLYRDALGRPPREAGIETNVRVESVVRYLSFRVEGCGHDEAEQRALRYLTGTRERKLCAPGSQDRGFPPVDQTYIFNVRLDRAAREREDTGHPTHVDLEGEAVWLQAYARERATGVTAREARATVLAQVRAAAGL
jgi:Family of unknown function (DUF6311)